MAALDRLKLWEKIIIIFVGDHGFHLGERGWWNKGTLFELSCRAPFIFVAPGVKPAVCRSLVEFMDIYPTVTDLCGLPLPDTVKGQSLKALLNDPSKTLRNGAITHLTRGLNLTGNSLRTDRWRYTEWNEGQDGVELYDHTNDPGEWRNLADDPKFAKERAELAVQLRAMR